MPTKNMSYYYIVPDYHNKSERNRLNYKASKQTNRKTNSENPSFIPVSYIMFKQIVLFIM